ncbi:hypothetical protein [Candidatus Vampirococcus lugosii]|uniref:Uncharacterized protein n=1 Tax=Candidatus Vampirococcus lugosii TaxID=2789015 RepID=A0ABS5QJM2_9BACT|nr:hypothetical protein [Candidatus Vampirococcus lugosii]MBS8121470.1 hypothetical protein [Candidatus Vampirococcus lugosii]
MLFDFQEFVQDLKKNPEKKSVLEKYEKIVGKIDGGLKDQKWYKEYISNFETIKYDVPEEIKEDFDWDLLIQLISGSFSSEGTLDNDGEKTELIVSVQSGDQFVVKKISELWGFQVLRLFQIYTEEQINLYVLMNEDEKEKESILAQRDSKLKRWNLVLENLETENIKNKEKKDKEDKLNDLMSKL